MAWISGNFYLSATQMANNAKEVWNNLGGAFNWTVNAVAGVLGNMQSESSINPGIWEGLQVNYNKGFGLVQWTPATKYIDWAGSAYEDGDLQCRRIEYEADNGLQWFANKDAPIRNPPISFRDFTRSELPPGLLANYFLWYYEHPANVNQPNRATQAEQWYALLAGVPPEPTPPLPTFPDTTPTPLWMYLKLI